MKPKIDEWTVVIAGLWNFRIFSPEWVTKNLFEDKKVEVEVGINTGLQQIRYIQDDIVFIPAHNRIIVAVKKTDDACLDRAEKLARKVVTLLPHTPLQGFGVNFGYSVSDAPESLTTLFNLTDIGALSDQKCNILRAEIARSIELNGQIINVKHVFSNAKHEVHLNFHYDFSSAEELEAKASGSATIYKKTGLDILQKVYGLILE